MKTNKNTYIKIIVILIILLSMIDVKILYDYKTQYLQLQQQYDKLQTEYNHLKDECTTYKIGEEYREIVNK